MYDCVNVCECHGRVPTDTTRSPPKGNHERMVVVTHGRKNGSKMLMFDGWFGVWWKRSGRTGIEDFKKTHTHTHTKTLNCLIVVIRIMASFRAAFPIGMVSLLLLLLSSSSFFVSWLESIRHIMVIVISIVIRMAVVTDKDAGCKTIRCSCVALVRLNDDLH